jgi:hypothetical protein
MTAEELRRGVPEYGERLCMSMRLECLHSSFLTELVHKIPPKMKVPSTFLHKAEIARGHMEAWELVIDADRVEYKYLPAKWDPNVLRNREPCRGEPEAASRMARYRDAHRVQFGRVPERRENRGNIDNTVGQPTP